jgi:hypothetical protein
LLLVEVGILPIHYDDKDDDHNDYDYECDDYIGADE